MSDGKEETYSPSETARLLKVTPHRVRQMLNSGDLVGERDERGHWRVSQRAVHALLEERPRRNRSRNEAADEREPHEGAAGERLRELEEKLERAQREIGRLEGARELEEVTLSSVQEQLSRERERADSEREKADEERRRVDELRAELEEARRPWWSKLFR